ncbi:MAG: GGDEF domain-containing protein [Acidobacteria bacterium]|nr:GGDEF domain-containing protein [Acidobacteriota bacterium]
MIITRRMVISQFALLVLEAALMATLVLSLFRARTVLGLSPLYIVMGGFQYLEATLSVQVALWPGVVIYPGSSVMFTANLFAVLLVYLKEDALEARKLVYGLVLANAGLTLVSLLVSAHFVLPGVAGGATVGGEEFVQNAQIAMVGAALLFVDVLGIILVYEYVSRHTRFFLLRVFLALAVIVAFDNLLFGSFVRWGQADFGAALLSGLVSKLGAALFYSVSLWGYLRFIEPRDVTVSEGDVADVFQMLTYRQKYEQARNRMIHDQLTGLHNRLHLEDVAPRALAHAHRYAEPISLMIVDGDGFKAINDRFSHFEGDRVIQLIGATLNAEVRAADIACRYGGDEFVVLLPRTDLAAARALAERIQARLRHHCASASPAYPWGTLTLTFGIAANPTDGHFTVVEELMRLADTRLYAGKRAGGNCVISADDAPDLGLAPASSPAPASI